MTDWIDELAAQLGPSEKEATIKRQHELMRDQIIEERGPSFCKAMAQTIVAQAEELDTKAGGAFGGVTQEMHDDKVTVKCGDGDHALKVKFSLNGRQIKAELKSPGLTALDSETRTFTLDVEGDTIVAWREKTKYTDPIAIATTLMKDAFGHL